jgi:hypothetical protein
MLVLFPSANLESASIVPATAREQKGKWQNAKKDFYFSASKDLEALAVIG